MTFLKKKYCRVDLTYNTTLVEFSAKLILKRKDKELFRAYNTLL